MSPKGERVRGWNFTDWGDDSQSTWPLTAPSRTTSTRCCCRAASSIRTHSGCSRQRSTFVKAFFDAGKPVAVICHGPWTVIEAGAARGRRIASWPSLKTDLRNAGAEWVDQEVVVDGNLVSSRKPDDIPAFNREMIELFSRVRGQARQQA